MTKVIALVSEKGGAGKTIAAVTLAVAAENHGLATVIFDLDPRANSAVWGDARDGRIPEVVPAQVPRLALLIEQARKNQADLVVLDTPGNGMAVAEAACAIADLILIPCRPFPPDLVSIVPTVRVALASGKPSFVLINAAPVQGSETVEARAAIEKAGVAVCPVVLHHRKAYVSRFHEGMTAFESDPRGKAADEALALFLWTCEQAGLVVNNQSIKETKQLASKG
jgi:chromosome partitioning protein